MSWNDDSPRESGYHPVPDWAPHAACITAWPAYQYAWGEHLEGARQELSAFLTELTREPGSEQVELLCASEELEQSARAMLGHLGERVVYRRMAYGDIWLRDIGPFFLRRNGSLSALCFGFNGWGGKYVYPHDAQVASGLAGALRLSRFSHDAVIEGGAVELDGEGTCLTTESCLLNDNRNPGRSRAAMEAVLAETLSVDKVIWLPEGLLGDHTDGHIDNIARFAAPGVVLHMLPTTDDDPNRGVLHRIADVLREARDAQGRELQRVVVPSPGHVAGVEGHIMAASYLNFYVGNRTVVVPAFGQPNDERARQAVASAFPDRRVVLCSARKLLEGGGTLHCITRELPEAAAKESAGASG